MYSYDMGRIINRPPSYSRHHFCEDSDEAEETGVLLQQVPYVEYQDEPDKQGWIRHSLSGQRNTRPLWRSCVHNVMSIDQHL